MHDPFGQLADEHRAIEQVLTALEAAAQREVPTTFYEDVIDFGIVFADGYHHAKEEERLFTYLVERGMPRDYGPLEEVFHAHDAGRSHLESMRASLAKGDLESVRRESLEYAALMRDHLADEDNVLFPMGRAMLTEGEIQEIGESFENVAEPSPSAAAYVEKAARLLASVTDPQ